MNMYPYISVFELGAILSKFNTNKDPIVLGELKLYIGIHIYLNLLKVVDFVGGGTVDIFSSK